MNGHEGMFPPGNVPFFFPWACDAGAGRLHG